MAVAQHSPIALLGTRVHVCLFVQLSRQRMEWQQRKRIKSRTSGASVDVHVRHQNSNETKPKQINYLQIFSMVHIDTILLFAPDLTDVQRTLEQHCVSRVFFFLFFFLQRLFVIKLHFASSHKSRSCHVRLTHLQVLDIGRRFRAVNRERGPFNMSAQYRGGACRACSILPE